MILVGVRTCKDLTNLLYSRCSPGWWNWKTPGTQNPVGCKAREGSTPSPGTIAFDSKNREAEERPPLLSFDLRDGL